MTLIPEFYPAFSLDTDRRLFAPCEGCEIIVKKCERRMLRNCCRRNTVLPGTWEVLGTYTTWTRSCKCVSNDFHKSVFLIVLPFFFVHPFLDQLRKRRTLSACDTSKYQSIKIIITRAKKSKQETLTKYLLHVKIRTGLLPDGDVWNIICSANIAAYKCAVLFVCLSNGRGTCVKFRESFCPKNREIPAQDVDLPFSRQPASANTSWAIVCNLLCTFPALTVILKTASKAVTHNRTYWPINYSKICNRVPRVYF